ncbi:MAG: FAD-dependent oxidoreductase [Planctomycetota bacterium]
MTDTTANGSSPILIIGGGIAGISCAVEASETGHEVYLVERNPYLGGRVVQMNKYFPKLCPPTCGVEIHLKRLRTTPRVHILTGATLAGVTGEPGAFQVELKIEPRGVNEKCTACGECVPVCPKERPDTFNYGLKNTKAVYLPFGSAFPYRYAIDFDHCDGESCKKCVEACAYDAIDLGEQERTQTLEVGSIIVATGWKPYEAENLESLAYGKAKNVVTNVEMERLAAADGPTEGKILRPSDQKEPETVAFVQCAGSRDELHLAHCSAVCCLASLKQARYVLEQYPEAKVHIFYIDVRAPGRLEDFFQELEENERVTLTKGKVAKIEEDASGDVTLLAEDTLSGEKVHAKASLAVLAVGLDPEAKSAGFPGEWQTDDHGFFPGATLAVGEIPTGAAPGVFAAGTAKRPGEVSACVKDATAAALKAIQTVQRG